MLFFNYTFQKRKSQIIQRAILKFDFIIQNNLKPDKQSGEMKRGNIFGIEPKQPGALQIMSNELMRILANPSYSESKIEVEIKYAQFKYFSPPQYIEILNRSSDNKQKQKLSGMAGLIQRERYFFKDSLKKMSHQQVVYLNPLGREIYQLISCFDEERYKKFYPMREYLIRQCEFNENFKSKNILLPESPKNIYHQYSQIGDNLQFQMQSTGEIRFDFIFKDPSSPLSGRYSYSNVTKSWIKTKKNQLIKQQIDVMLTEKTFRFAVNQQNQTQVSYQDLEALRQQLIKRKFKQVDIRLKRTMRCTKGNLLQFSLSEVFQPQKKQGSIQAFEDLQKFITEDYNVFDNYLLQKFQYFYIYRKPEDMVDVTKAETKYEVECEFTAEGIKLLRQYAEKRQYRQIYYELQETIQSLYNLFFADHSVRTQEAPWLDKIMKSKQQNSGILQLVYPGQRLVNEFGSYMHNIVFEEMTFIKNH